MAALKEMPFGHDYGSVDATPLFVAPSQVPTMNAPAILHLLRPFGPYLFCLE